MRCHRPPPAESPSPCLFEARGIHKRYNSHHQLEVLKGVDLAISAGEMIAVVGTSGTGKTTLLHILGTLDRPTSGSLFYQGQNLFASSDLELSAFRNRTIGFVFQFHQLLPEFTALENVMLPGLIGRRPRQALRREAGELLDRVGLAARADHRVGELSGGEQQRVALARALVMKPALLLADEPTGNLDPATGETVFQLICELNRSLDLAMVMVTHNLRLADRMDRCLTLANGRLHPALAAGTNDQQPEPCPP